MDWTKVISKVEYGESEKILEYLYELTDHGLDMQTTKVIVDYDFNEPKDRISYVNKKLYKAYEVDLKSKTIEFDSLDLMISIVQSLERLRDYYRARLNNMILRTRGGIGQHKEFQISFIIYDENDYLDWKEIFLP